MEPTTIAGLVSAAVSVTSKLRAASNDIDDREVRAAVSEIVVKVNRLRAELQEKGIELQADNDELRRQLRLRVMEMRDGMLWHGEDGPFCPGCAAEGKEAHVSKNPANGYWVCNACQRSPVGAEAPPLPDLPRRGDFY